MNGDRNTGLSSLTPRELEVLKLICEGLSIKEIASQLYRSPKTIEGHRGNLAKKLGLNDRVKIVRWAIREGVVEP